MICLEPLTLSLIKYLIVLQFSFEYFVLFDELLANGFLLSWVLAFILCFNLMIVSAFQAMNILLLLDLDFLASLWAKTSNK